MLNICRYSVIYLSKPEKVEKKLKKALGQHKEQSGIIYCRTTAQADELCVKLEVLPAFIEVSVILQKRAFFDCCVYHSKLPPSDLQKRLEEWMNGKVKIIVATSALSQGMQQSSSPDELSNTSILVSAIGLPFAGCISSWV